MKTKSSSKKDLNKRSTKESVYVHEKLIHEPQNDFHKHIHKDIHKKHN